MSKTRIKTTASPIRTRDEMEALVGDIARLKAKEQQYTAEMNQRVTEVRRDYEAGLSGVQDELSGKMALARDWAEAHPEEFGKARSIAMTHGDVGWRIGNPTLKTLSGWTWDRVLEKLRGGGAWLKYLRVKQEVNKEALLADREVIALSEAGCRVVQDETFFIEPRIEATETTVKAPAEGSKS